MAKKVKTAPATEGNCIRTAGAIPEPKIVTSHEKTEDGRPIVYVKTAIEDEFKKTYLDKKGNIKEEIEYKAVVDGVEKKGNVNLILNDLSTGNEDDALVQVITLFFSDFIGLKENRPVLKKRIGKIPYGIIVDPPMLCPVNGKVAKIEFQPGLYPEENLIVVDGEDDKQYHILVRRCQPIINDDPTVDLNVGDNVKAGQKVSDYSAWFKLMSDPESLFNFLANRDAQKYPFANCQKQNSIDKREVFLNEEFNDYTLMDKMLLFFAKHNPDLIEKLPRYATDEMFQWVRKECTIQRPVALCSELLQEEPYTIYNIIDEIPGLSDEKKKQCYELIEEVRKLSRQQEKEREKARLEGK